MASKVLAGAHVGMIIVMDTTMDTTTMDITLAGATFPHGLIALRL